MCYRIAPQGLWPWGRFILTQGSVISVHDSQVCTSNRLLDGLLLCVRSEPSRSRCPNGIKCAGDLLGEMFVDYKERRDRSGRVEPSDHGAGLTRARGEGPSRPLDVCCLWNRKEVALTGSSRGGMASEEPKGQSWSCWAAVLPAAPSLNLNATPLWPVCHTTE